MYKLPRVSVLGANRGKSGQIGAPRQPGRILRFWRFYVLLLNFWRVLDKKQCFLCLFEILTFLFTKKTMFFSRFVGFWRFFLTKINAFWRFCEILVFLVRFWHKLLFSTFTHFLVENGAKSHLLRFLTAPKRHRRNLAKITYADYFSAAKFL